MGVTSLVCPCGRRLKTAGAAPGASGRCPACGRTLRIPETVSDDDVCRMLRQAPEVARAEPAEPPAIEEDEWNWQGDYDLMPADPPRSMPRAIDPAVVAEPLGPWPDEAEPLDVQRVAPTAATADGEWDWRGAYELDAIRPATTKVSETSSKNDEDAAPRPPLVRRGAAVRKRLEDAEPSRRDSWCPPHLLYPSRGAEGLVMVAAIGGAAWVMGTLAPEYGLAILADGERMGVPSLGRLIALISALPVMILSPLVIVYGLQYLSRVLVASSDGERLPPRPPDRNVDGLMDGVGAWIRWLVLGVGVGLLPLAVYRTAIPAGASWNPALAAALGLAGLPYILMAFLMAFLHDDDLAARPWAVLAAIAKFGPSFLGLCLTVAGLFAVVGIGFAVVMALRERAFWAYIPMSLSCWMLAMWISMVAMHTLGSYHALRKGCLDW